MLELLAVALVYGLVTYAVWVYAPDIRRWPTRWLAAVVAFTVGLAAALLALMIWITL